MELILRPGKASSIYYNGDFYDTNRKLELPFSDGFRMSRLAASEAVYDDVSYDPKLFRDKKFFNLMADVDMTSGFGGVSYNLIKKSSEYDIALAGRTSGVDDPVILRARSKELQQSGAMVWHDQPRENWHNSPFEKNIAIVPFETTRIPASWIPRINAFDALLVPCEQNIEVFRDSGVTIPIELIHWGVDADLFPYIERPEHDIFTFGTMGALSIRKGTDVLVQAFQEAFPRNQKDVQLICKTSYNHWQFGAKDERIKVLTMPSTHEELIRDFWKKIDVFVFPTRGEGAGNPPLEAAATGVPVIVTGWSGPADYINDEMGWALDYSFAPAQEFTDNVYKEDCGDWVEPSKEHLVHLMRNAYENRDETKAKGKTASAYIHRDWLWEKRIKEFHESLAKHL